MFSYMSHVMSILCMGVWMGCAMVVVSIQPLAGGPGNELRNMSLKYGPVAFQWWIFMLVVSWVASIGGL